MALLKGMIWTCTRKSVSRPNTETNDFQQSVPVLQASTAPQPNIQLFQPERLRRTHLLLIPNTVLVVNIPLHPVPHLVLRISHTHQHAALHLGRDALADRLFQHGTAEDDEAGFDVGSCVFEVVAVEEREIMG